MVTVLLAVSVVSTVVVWTEGSSKKPLQVVRGVIGAENADFFGDPRVKAAFAERGLDLRISTVGETARSRRRSSGRSTTSRSALERRTVQPILISRHITTSSVPFFTPLVVATFTDIAQVLERAGVARDHGGWWTLDMKAFLDLVARHVRWNELPGNTAYPSTNIVADHVD